MTLLLLAFLGCSGSSDLTVGPVALPEAEQAVPVSMETFLVPITTDPDPQIRCDQRRASLPGRYAVVTITPSALWLGDQPIYRLAAGRVSATETRGQLLSTLYDGLLELAEANKDLGARTGCEHLEFRGDLLVVADAAVPFSTLRQVVFTGGQAQFGNFAFLVDDDDPTVAPDPAEASAEAPTLRVDATGLTLARAGRPDLVLPCRGSCTRRARYDWKALEAALTQARAEAVVLVPTGDVPYDVLVGVHDRASTAFSQVILAGGVGDEGLGAPATLPSARDRSLLRLRATDRVAVLRTTLPAIGAPASADEPGRGLLPRLIATRGAASEVDNRASDLAGATLATLLGDREPPEEPATRAWFPETLLFAPAVITDASGQASVPVTLPDQLTTWRILGLAHEAGGAQAGTVLSLPSTLAAYIELEPPAVVRVGDVLELPIQAVNTTPDPFVGELEVSVDGAAASGTASWSIDLGPFGSVTRRLPLATLQPGVAIVRARLGDHDVIEKRVTVLPPGRRLVQQAGGSLGAARTHTFRAPGDAWPDASSVELTVVAGPLGIVSQELRAAPQRGGGLAEQAYVAALAGRAPHLATQLGARPPDPAVQRRQRLKAWQGLAPHVSRPTPVEALVALLGASHLDDEAARVASARLRDVLDEVHSPDGSFALATGDTTLEHAVVFAATAATAVPDLRAIRATAAFLERSAPSVVEACTAATALATGQISGPAATSLWARVDAALPEGSGLVTPGPYAVRVDGSPATPVDCTAAVVAALTRAGRTDEAADLASVLLTSWRRDTGFGDGLAGLAAVDALSGAMVRSFPDSVALSLVASDGTTLAAHTVQLGRGQTHAQLDGPAPSSQAPLTVHATPPVPGLVYTLSRVDWVPLLPPAEAGVTMRVLLPDRPRLGEPSVVTVQAAVPANRPFTVAIELPAGARAERGSLEALVEGGGLTGFHEDPSTVELRAPAQPAGATFSVSFEVAPSLVGDAAWGAATLTVQGERSRPVAVGRWTVASP